MQNSNSPPTRIIAADVVKNYVRKVGAERTRRGLEELDEGHLIYAAPELFKDNDNGKSGPYAGRVGDDLGNSEGGRSCRTGDDVTREVDRGLGNVGGADAGKRRDDCREVDERLEQLEARA